MSAIGTVEDAMIAAVKAALGATVKTVESLPAGFDAAELQRRRRVAPAVYIAFLGGSGLRETTPAIDATFAAFAMTEGAGDESARRRGGAVTIGAYEIMEAVAAKLDGLVVDGVGSLVLDDVANLFSDKLDAEGLSLYSASFKIPLAFQRAAPSALGSFQKFDAQYDIPPLSGYSGPLPAPAADVDAEDDVILPGA